MLKKILDRLRNGNRDVYILMLGTVVSQGVPMLAYLALARLYTKEDFGLFGVYFSISMIGTVFMTLRYEMAIMLPESREDARHLTVLSCLISCAFSLLTLLLVVLFRHQLSDAMHEPRLANILFLMPFTLLVIGVYQALNYWSNRMAQYKRLAFSRMARAVNSSGLGIVFGFVAVFKSTGMIIGDTIGQAIAALFLGGRILREEPGLFRKVDRETLKTVARRYKQFPLFNVPSGLLEKLSGNLPSLILAPFFGLGMVGLLAISQRVISVPGSVIARAYGDVFRQKATDRYNQHGECHGLFMSTFKKLVLLGIPGFVLLYFIVVPAFVLLFGEDWREAGVYAQILMPMFLLQFIVSPLSNMFLVAEQQKTDFVLQICLFLAIVSALYGGYYVYGTARATLILYSGVYSAKYLVEFALSYRFSKGRQHAG